MTGIIDEIYGVVLAVYLATYTLLVVAMVDRRRLQPLKAREPLINLVRVIGDSVVVCMICLREQDPDLFPCGAYVFISNLFPASHCAPYFLRTFRLCMYRRINVRLVQEYKSNTMKAYTKWTYVTEGMWISNGITLFVAALIATTHISLAYFELALLHPYDHMSSGCKLNEEFVLFAGIAAFYFCAIVVCIWVLRLERDSLGISREIRSTMTISLVCGIVFLVFNMWRPLFRYNDVFPTSSWIIAAVVLCSVVSDIFPTLCTYWRSSAPVQITVDDLGGPRLSITDLFEDKVYLSKFEEYCVSIYCPELVMFYHETKIYSTLPVAKRAKQAIRIRDEYFCLANQWDPSKCPHGPLPEAYTTAHQVTALKKTMADTVGDFPSNLFEELVSRMKDAVEHYLLRTFIDSPYFQEARDIKNLAGPEQALIEGAMLG